MSLRIFLVILMFSVVSGAGLPLDEWNLRGPLPTTRELTDLAEGRGVTVVTFGDDGGRVLTSEDGKLFELEDAGLADGEFLQRVEYGNNRWLAAGNGKVWTKELWTDEWTLTGDFPVGIDELKITESYFWAWREGRYSSGSFSERVWIGSQLFRSSNGMDWVEVNLTDSPEERLAISGLAEIGGRFVLTNSEYGGLKTNGLWASDDGADWSPIYSGQTRYFSVAGGGGLFMAGGSNGSVAVSEDGVIWRYEQFPYVIGYVSGGINSPGTPRYSSPQNLVFYEGKFVALAGGHGGVPLVVASEDGIEWEVIASNVNWPGSTGTWPQGLDRAEITSLRLGGGGIYALGEHGNLWTTTDWETDLERLLPWSAWNWRAVSASDEVVVAVGEKGRFMWSEDGVTFTSGELPEAAEAYAMAWSGTEFVAVGGTEVEARVWRSENGMSWESEEVSWLGAPMHAVIWDGRKFVMAGEGGRMTSSPDGRNWSFAGSGTTRNLRHLAFHDGRYVVTSDDGFARWTEDLSAWKEHEIGGDESRISYGNGVWMFGQWRPQLTSDFEVWWEKENGNTGKCLFFAFGHFATIYGNGRIGISADGTRWEGYGDLFGGEEHGDYRQFRDAAVFQNRLVAVGDDGIISVSAPWRDLFAEWQLEKFSAEALEEAGISGADADPDEDGWSNALEYAFDSDPLVDERETRPELRHYYTELAGGFDSVHGYTGELGSYRYPRAERRAGVAMWVERSEALKEWGRDDIVTYTGRNWITKREQFHSRVMLPPGKRNLLRLRAKVVRGAE